VGAISGVFATVLSVIGFEILSLGLHAKTYSWSRRFDKNNGLLRAFYKRFNLETGLVFGLTMIGVGGWILASFVSRWVQSDLMPLSHPEWASFGGTLVIIGFGTVFSSLFISAMSMKRVASYEQ
jgi:hypothetical protein